MLEITEVFPVDTSSGRGLLPTTLLWCEVKLDITGGIPVSPAVAGAVIHPMDVPNSLLPAMVHAICGSLRLLLGADDHKLVLIGSILALTLVFGESKLNPCLWYGSL